MKNVNGKLKAKKLKNTKTRSKGSAKQKTLVSFTNEHKEVR